MPTPYLIPLQANNQKFQITLAGVIYTMTVRWNEMNQAWQFDLADSNNNPILSVRPIVTGVDLLAPYAYLNIGGQLVAPIRIEPRDEQLEEHRRDIGMCEQRP